MILSLIWFYEIMNICIAKFSDKHEVFITFVYFWDLSFPNVAHNMKRKYPINHNRPFRSPEIFMLVCPQKDKVLSNAVMTQS